MRPVIVNRFSSPGLQVHFSRLLVLQDLSQPRATNSQRIYKKRACLT